MSAEFAIRLAGVGKFYPMFMQPGELRIEPGA
jgi:hypothetical protein